MLIGMDDDRREPVAISCDDCQMQGSSACSDCVVSFILEHDPGDAVIIDLEEARAVRLLAGAGLVPRLRHVPRSG
jgi:hypothetical protein